MYDQLRQLYRDWSGKAVEQITPLPGAGSDRRYFRLSGPAGPVIGTLHDNLPENEAFFHFAQHFHQLGLAVPELLAVGEDRASYLQEDLGDHSLYNELRQATGFSPQLEARYRAVLPDLLRLQIEGDRGLHYEKGYPVPRFDRISMQWDLYYFKYLFVKLQDLPVDEYRLENEFGALLDWLEQAPHWYFMHRDCQSRNILLQNDRPYFIDFQGGRKGPLAYDLVSLLWQARARMPFAVREQMLTAYCRLADDAVDFSEDQFRQSYYGFVLLRSLQVLGAYGLRGLVQRKPHFLESIPHALQNLRWLFDTVRLPVDVSEIQSLLEPLEARFPVTDAPEAPGLRVHLTSFSYRRGIPADPGGNGGGYVFDCRALHNPGRYEAYKRKTGLDPGVQQFLREKSNIESFLEPVFRLVDSAVDTYVTRGFSDLQISFGCTGGQHRSVYSAERLREHLADRPGVTVLLKHREQRHWPR